MATSGGTGGTSTTAASARKVYRNPALRQRLVDLCPDEYKHQFDTILFHSKLTQKMCYLCNLQSVVVYITYTIFPLFIPFTFCSIF